MSILKKVLLVLFIGFLILAGVFLIPRSYDVLAFEKRPGTQYWHLNTGSKIGYTLIESEGEERRSPIIYLHGGPGGMIVDDVIDILKPLSENGHDLYFYDQIGSGHSARLKNIKEYSVERHVRDLHEIIEKTNSEKVILFGHSWGTMLAMNYLADNDSRVEKMILSGPGPILPIKHELSKIKSPDSLNLKTPKYSNKQGNEAANNVRSKLIWRWAYMFNKKLASDAEADDFFTHLNTALSRSTVCDGSEVEMFPGGCGYYSHIMTVKSFKGIEDKRQKLKALETPILIIKGQCDNQKWGFTKEYLDLMENSRLEIIENSGHSLTKENQNEYLERIINFLK